MPGSTNDRRYGFAKSLAVTLGLVIVPLIALTIYIGYRADQLHTDRLVRYLAEIELGLREKAAAAQNLAGIFDDPSHSEIPDVVGIAGMSIKNLEGKNLTDACKPKKAHWIVDSGLAFAPCLGLTKASVSGKRVTVPWRSLLPDKLTEPDIREILITDAGGNVRFQLVPPGAPDEREQRESSPNAFVQISTGVAQIDKELLESAVTFFQPVSGNSTEKSQKAVRRPLSCRRAICGSPLSS